MWNRASLALNGVLAVGLVLTSRRLHEVRADLARARARAAVDLTGSDGRAPAQRLVAADPMELAAEWEQAILPSDS